MPTLFIHAFVPICSILSVFLRMATNPLTELLFLSFWRFLLNNQVFKRKKQPTVCHFPLTPILLGGLLPLCFRCFASAFASCTPKSAAPEVVLTHFLHKHTRAAVAGLRLCLLHPAHIHPTFLFMSTFIYPRKSGGFPPSLELLNLFCVTFCHCRFLKWFSVFRGPRGTVIIQLIMSSCCC